MILLTVKEIMPECVEYNIKAMVNIYSPGILMPQFSGWATLLKR